MLAAGVAVLALAFVAQSELASSFRLDALFDMPSSSAVAATEVEAPNPNAS